MCQQVCWPVNFYAISVISHGSYPSILQKSDFLCLSFDIFKGDQAFSKVSHS